MVRRRSQCRRSQSPILRLFKASASWLSNLKRQWLKPPDRPGFSWRLTPGFFENLSIAIGTILVWSAVDSKAAVIRNWSWPGIIALLARMGHSPSLISAKLQSWLLRLLDHDLIILGIGLLLLYLPNRSWVALGDFSSGPDRTSR